MGFRRSCRSRSLRRRDTTPTRGYGPTHEERREGSMTTATPTQLGMVGLGRMGANIVRRLMRDGHPCVVHDLSSEAVATLVSEGATGANTLDAFVAALTPGVAAGPRTPGAASKVAMQEEGYLRVGPVGAGHFVKMVHNGIEYALMAAYAEGMNILHHANVGGVAQQHDAETAPLGDPAFYRYDIDVAAGAELWRPGSVVSSSLLDLPAAAVHAPPTPHGVA